MKATRASRRCRKPSSRWSGTGRRGSTEPTHRIPLIEEVVVMPTTTTSSSPHRRGLAHADAHGDVALLPAVETFLVAGAGVSAVGIAVRAPAVPHVEPARPASA